MGEISRRRFLQKAGEVIFVPSALSLLGCNAVNEIVDEASSFDPADPNTYIETYVDDVSLPPESDDPYAQRLYAYSDNALNDPGKLLFRSDFDYAEFQVSEESPLEVVVGFAMKPSRVNIGWNGPGLNVEGYAANAFVLAKGRFRKLSGDENLRTLAKPIRFVADLSRGESGYAEANPFIEGVSGGDIQIDTGPGSSRYFIFRAEGNGKVSIDYLKAGG